MSAQKKDKQIDFSRSSFGRELWVNASEIYVNPLSQRKRVNKHVKDIIKEFDPNKFGRIIISYRPGYDKDGKYHIIEGQHRFEAATTLGVKEIPCVLIPTKNIKEDADAYLGYNTNRQHTTGADKYRIGLTAEDPKWLKVKEMLIYAGMPWEPEKVKLTYLGAIARHSFFNHSYENTFEAFNIMSKIWNPEECGSSILGGIIVFYINYIKGPSPQTTAETFITKIKNDGMTPKEIVSDATELKLKMGSGDIKHHVANLLVGRYNTKTRKKSLKLNLV